MCFGAPQSKDEVSDEQWMMMMVGLLDADCEHVMKLLLPALNQYHKMS
jgi:hypothetical protein